MNKNTMITLPARTLIFLVTVACAGLLLALPGSAFAADSGQTTCDFDGDGHNDLAVGAPGENNGKGAVNIQYHDDGFLNDPQFLHFGWLVDRAGLGTALACGDFNDDGYDDLAVGAPDDHPEGGSVFVLYGNAERGLATNDFQKFSQALPGIPGHTGQYEDFGFALAVGDFGDDGYDDLAVGDPREIDTDYLDGDEAGTVIVVQGSSSGLDLDGAVQQISGGARHSHDERRYQRFGASLAAAPVVSGNGGVDDIDDLVVGAPETGINAHLGKSGRTYVFASDAQLVNHLFQHQMVDQASIPHGGGLAEWNRFGYALATGDFDADGHTDVAIGTPYYDYTYSLDPKEEAGKVLVFGSNGYKLDLTNPKIVLQETIGGKSEPGDHYGWSLASGDWDIDGHDDLAVGAPTENIGSTVNAGAVFVHYGNESLISSQGRILHQGKASTPDAPHLNDWFGAGLTSISLWTGENDDLVIGVPGEAFPTRDPDCAQSGTLHLALGWFKHGPATDTGYMLHQDTGAPYHVADQRECSAADPPYPPYLQNTPTYHEYFGGHPHGEFFGWAAAF